MQPASPKSPWLSYVPTEPLEDQSELKALYTKGQDHRRNLYDGVDEKIRQQARSVACLVENTKLVKKANSYEWDPTVPTATVRLGGNKPLSHDTPFRNELSPGFGTAFLVADRLVLTAGHCVCIPGTKELRGCKTFRVVFGFYLEAAGRLATLKKSLIGKPIQVLARSQDMHQGDWALVKLKRHPEWLLPLPIDFFNVIHKSLAIYMLGHPSGLPLKYTDSGIVKEREMKKSTEFEAQIDAFAGNSGSPVFNASTGQVIGILVRGNTDYDMGMVTTRHEVTPEEIQKFGYEKCQRITALPDHVIELINPHKFQTRKKAINDCLKADRLIKEEQREEAIGLLKPLSDDGVQAASCVLSALETSPKKIEKYKQLALSSGFFSQASIGDVLQSVTVIRPVTEARAKKLKVDGRSDIDVVAMEGSRTRLEDATVTRKSSIRLISGATQEPVSSLSGKKKKK